MSQQTQPRTDNSETKKARIARKPAAPPKLSRKSSAGPELSRDSIPSEPLAHVCHLSTAPSAALRCLHYSKGSQEQQKVLFGSGMLLLSAGSRVGVRVLGVKSLKSSGLKCLGLRSLRR